MVNHKVKSNKSFLIVVAVAIILLLIGTVIYIITSDDSEQNVATEAVTPPPDPSTQATENTEAPTTDTEDPDKGLVELDIDLVRVEPTGEVVIAGRYDPNSIVRMATGGKVYGETKANKIGEWVIVFEENLEPGSYQFQVITQKDENAEEILHDTEVTVLVPENLGGDEVLVAVNTGEGATEILQLPGDSESETSESEKGFVTEAENVTEAITEQVEKEIETVTAEEGQNPEVEEDSNLLAIRAVESEDGKIFVAGEGKQGATIVVFVDDQFLGSTNPNHHGNWLIEAEMDLGPGVHDVTARIMDTSTQKPIASVSVKFEKAEDSNILIPQITVLQSRASGTAGDRADVRVNSPSSVIIRRGDNLWTISRRLYGRGIRYTTIYETNKDQIDDPDLIFPGQTFLTPQRDLNWTD